jgi:carnitine-CoA ligase
MALPMIRTSTPYAGRDVGWLVDRWVARSPQRRFLTWAPFDEPSTGWTWAAFGRDVGALAAAFRRRGVVPGDRVALVLPNHPDFLLAWTALVRLGAVAVCLNPRYSRDELGYATRHSGVVGVLADARRSDDVSAAAPRAWVMTSGGSGPDSVAAALRTEPLTSYAVVTGHQPASLQYTSGTTARPKGVVWTQANCLWAGQVGAAHQGLGPGDVNLTHLPLFHTNALSYSFLSTLWSGGGIVLQPRFSASRFWPASVEHGATWTSVVSFCLRALAEHDVPAEHRYRGWGNSYCLDPAPVTGGVHVVGWFGMTETVSHPIVGGLLHPDRAGTMGRPAPEYEVAVVGADRGPVAPGEVGELWVRGVRGVSLFASYLDDDEATAGAWTDDGWFVTGDRVRPDEDGTITFVERDKDVLKVGGENIGAPEIERVLLEVAGVREAVVVGRPDVMLGEVPVAFVTTSDGATVTPGQLAERCAELLADFKQPREVRIVDDLPRSTLDKVAKGQLRELLAREAADA